MRLGRLELGVTFDEFFCAAAREADGDAAVVFVAFNSDNGANAVFRVAYFAAEHGVGGSTARRRTAETWRFRTLARGGRTLGCHGAASDPAHEFFGRVRIFGIGFVAARLADFRHGAAG